MKKILLTLLLLVSYFGFSQTLTTPTSQEVPVGVNGIGISGFSLDGYDVNTTYKVSLSITGNANATFSVNTTTGLTRDYGYNSWTNISAVNFTGKPSDIENGLNSIKFNTTSTIDGLINLSVLISSQQTNTYYNPDNGHMYKFVSGTYTIGQARSGALNSTFEGESGYLVNITSAAEQTFINQKVLASNVWIGLEDDGHEGVWKWMDGPEAGQTSTYYNWCNSEPNNWSSGEDYVVTKWYGSPCWNDFGPPSTTTSSSIGGYIVEYGTWTDPTQSTFNSTQQTQITFTQKNIPYLTYQFNFNNNVDISNWGGRMYYRNTPTQILTDRTEDIPLSSNGFVNATSQIYPAASDGTKKATTVGGSVEWCVLYDYDNTNSRHRVLIDKREFPSVVSATDVSSLQLFDLYDGDVTFYREDTYWAQYYIYTDTPLSTSNTNYSSYIRDAGSYLGLRAEFSFEDNVSLPEQYFVFKNFSRTEVQQMIDDIVTVSDVVLAFNELAGGGLNGGLKGDLGGIQLALGDVDKNGQFDFQDTYKMLQHLQGTEVLYSSQNLANILVARPKSEYEGYSIEDWSGGIHSKTSVETNITDSNLVQQLEYNIGFKGDVNLSHSTYSTDVTTTSLVSKISRINTLSSTKMSISKSVEQQTDLFLNIENGEEIIVSLSLPQNQNSIVGTQFRLAFDNTKVSFDRIEVSDVQIQNFQSTRSDYINFGSISTDGSHNLNNGIEYKIYFKPNEKMDTILGLVSLTKTEVIDNNGINIEMIVR